MGIAFVEALAPLGLMPVRHLDLWEQRRDQSNSRTWGSSVWWRQVRHATKRRSTLLDMLLRAWVLRL